MPGPAASTPIARWQKWIRPQISARHLRQLARSGKRCARRFVPGRPLLPAQWSVFADSAAASAQRGHIGSNFVLFEIVRRGVSTAGSGIEFIHPQAVSGLLMAGQPRGVGRCRARHCRGRQRSGRDGRTTFHADAAGGENEWRENLAEGRCTCSLS